MWLTMFTETHRCDGQRCEEKYSVRYYESNSNKM